MRAKYRRRKVMTEPIEGHQWPTVLYVRSDIISIKQDRSEYARGELVIIDRDTMLYLIDLWKEVTNGNDKR